MKKHGKIFCSFVLANFVLCLLPGFVQGQKEAWNWYFGANAGIEFSSGVPWAVTNGAMNNYEGVASISDSSGNLLFYTNGQTVYNSTHVPMTNGYGLLGNSSATQSAIIVKKPGSDSLYYIFTVDYNHNGMATGDGLNYSIVDMSLNGGLGNVTLKNFPVRLPVYEKVTAVKHGNNIDYWILINDWLSDDIYAYLLDTGGLSLNPVASNAGPIHLSDFGNTAGYMKASFQGNKIAIALWGKNGFDLFDFDNQTGIASNQMVITSNDMFWTYGVEFSNDGTKIYSTKLEAPSCLYQFDLMGGTPTTILNSRVTLASNPNDYYYCALQMGPDHDLYCSLRYYGYLGVIHDPDSAGMACNYVNNGVYLAGNNGLMGLPNFTPDYIMSPSTLPVVAIQSSDTSFCEKKCIDFFDLSTNQPTSWQWYFPGADSTSSNLQNPTGICYNSYGTFDVILIACNTAGCDTLILPDFISEFQNPPVPVITSHADTLFCSPAFSYQWYDSNGPIPGATGDHYIYQQQGGYFVIITDSNGCASSSAVIYTAIDIPENYSNEIKLVPGLLSGDFTVELLDPQQHIHELRIYDVTGKDLFHATPGIKSNGVHVQLRQPVSGIYLMLIRTGKTVMNYKLLLATPER